jgi:peptidoglycan hydrolase-like protein with peptidoglycan-binding domain
MKKLTLSCMCLLMASVNPVSADVKDVAKGLLLFGIANEISKNRKKSSPKSSNTSTRSVSPKRSSVSRAQWVQIQARLNELGYNAGPADGQPGSRTKGALVAFQRANGLTADGVYGEKTKAALFGGAVALTATAAVASPEQQLDPMISVVGDEPASSLTSVQSEAVFDFASLEIAQLIANQDGIWEGRLQCSGSPRVDIDVVLSVTPSVDRYRAHLTTYSSATGAGRTEQDTFVGEANSTPGSFLFARSTATGTPISGTEIVSFTIDDEQNGNVLLSSSDTSCAPTEMELVDKRARPSFALAVAEGGGSFGLANDVKGKCAALVEWASPLQDVTGSQIDILFTDRVFVPVFGQPYDTLSASQLGNIFERDVKKGNSCTSDPVMKARFQDTDKYLKYGFSREAMTTNRVYTNRVVQRNRLVNNLAAIMISQELNKPVSDTDLQSYSELENLVTVNAYALWPDEKQKTLEWVRNSRAAQSELAASMYKASLVEIDDPTAKLEALKGYESLVATQLRYLPMEDKRVFEEEMQTLQASLSEEIVQPHLDRARSAKLSLEGIRDIRTGPMVDVQAFEVLNDEVRQQSLIEIEEEVSSRLSMLMMERMSELSAFGADTKGLRDSKIWLENFSQDFAEFSDSAEYKELLSEYSRFRETQLENALPEFQSNLETAKSNEQIDMLKSMYIASTEDAELPIALEYEFWAEAAKN